MYDRGGHNDLYTGTVSLKLKVQTPPFHLLFCLLACLSERSVMYEGICGKWKTFLEEGKRKCRAPPPKKKKKKKKSVPASNVKTFFPLRKSCVRFDK